MSLSTLTLGLLSPPLTGQIAPYVCVPVIIPLCLSLAPLSGYKRPPTPIYLKSDPFKLAQIYTLLAFLTPSSTPMQAANFFSLLGFSAYDDPSSLIGTLLIPPLNHVVSTLSVFCTVTSPLKIEVFKD